MHFPKRYPLVSDLHGHKEGNSSYGVKCIMQLRALAPHAVGHLKGKTVLQNRSCIGVYAVWGGAAVGPEAVEVSIAPLFIVLRA